jgi:AAA+ ATPase superfamily predicted ATPase
MDFVGRRRELGILGEELALVRQDHGRFVWLRGRRRIGKSRLVEQFLRQSKVRYAYYQAPRRETQIALKRFSETIAESGLPAAGRFGSGVSFDSWPAALRACADDTHEDWPIALVIDELPYLVEKDDGFPADLQHVWDRHLCHKPILLIAIGSDVRMMETLTQHPAELHDRPSRELIVPPLSVAEVAELTGTNASEALDIYLMVGGFPQLASSWRPGTSPSVFLQQALGDSATRFVVDGMRILDAEFAAETSARKVLESIGHGERTFGQIRAKSGVSNETTLSTALHLLVVLKRVVTESLPYAVPTGKKNKRYTIEDPYLRFWLRFIGPNIEEIDRGRSDLVIARVQRDWQTFRGKAIEPLVRRSVERLLADPDFSERVGGARYVGGYWTRSNQVEVDLVGGDSEQPQRIGFIGSIKWRATKPFGRTDAAALAQQRASVPGAGAAKLVAVSLSGFETVDLDARLGPGELVDAWRGSAHATPPSA